MNEFQMRPARFLQVDTLRLLRFVFVTVEHGSMRKAALAMGVQQSAVSRHITTIEQTLDIRIFERSRAGVRLTDEGRDFLEQVQPHYDGLREALALTSGRMKDVEKLRIGLSAPIGREFLLKLIDRFARTYPEIDVGFSDGSPARHAQALRIRELDAAFMCACCKTKGCQSETLFEERFVVLLPETHRLAAKAELAWDDLGGERLLVPTGPDGPALDSCLTDLIVAGENPPVVEHCQATQATVIVKVQMGKGFTLSGESFAKSVSVAGTVWRPVTGRQSTGAVKIVWLDSNPGSSLQRLVTMAKNMAREGRRK